jgi:hypothetical protein
MTGPEHFKQAEKELDRAYVEPIDDGTAGYHLARAQVHATLALAAAQALMPVVAEHSDPEASPVLNEWVDAAGRPS